MNEPMRIMDGKLRNSIAVMIQNSEVKSEADSGSYQVLQFHCLLVTGEVLSDFKTPFLIVCGTIKACATMYEAVFNIYKTPLFDSEEEYSTVQLLVGSYMQTSMVKTWYF